MSETRYSNRLSAIVLPLVQLLKAKCKSGVRFLAGPRSLSPQIWSCQSLFGRHTIRFGSVQSVMASARAETEETLNFPIYSPVPYGNKSGQLKLC